jgi:bis(5'-nucleosyl)-tetraphosphatase (symmetrical)
MATYAIGDIQGCHLEFQRLLEQIAFDPAADRLWLTGDLVNRGPQSLEVLRSVRALGEAAITVLGNHDLHLLMLAEGHSKQREDDTLGPILAAPDRDELLDWLRQQRMLHVEAGHVMVHAGLLPQWSVKQAARLAAEVETALRAADYRTFLAHTCGAANPLPGTTHSAAGNACA